MPGSYFLLQSLDNVYRKYMESIRGLFFANLLTIYIAGLCKSAYYCSLFEIVLFGKSKNLLDFYEFTGQIYIQ